MTKRLTLQGKLARADRIARANAFLRSLASECGVASLINPATERVSLFILDSRARVWYWDAQTHNRVFVRESAQLWHNFSGDWELARLVYLLYAYCQTGRLDQQALVSTLHELALIQEALPLIVAAAARMMVDHPPDMTSDTTTAAPVVV